jgi:hypothetical protein
MNSDISYKTVYILIKQVKQVIIENSDLIHYGTFIYIWER